MKKGLLGLVLALSLVACGEKTGKYKGKDFTFL